MRIAPRPWRERFRTLVALAGLLALGFAPRPHAAAGRADPLPLTAPAGDALVRWAAIGDYGADGQPEAEVAALVRGWNPDFIISLGDNNYPLGSASSIDANIGKHYHDFIGNYHGNFGPGASLNRFFPSLGNHDWYAPAAAPYLEYFTLPHNERYYSFVWGLAEFFVLDSDPHEPDGITATSIQADWLRDQLSASSARWKLIHLHHAPFSSSLHGSQAELAWPFQAWGADAVLAGHDHVYERIGRDGLVYFVNGLGGHPSLYSFGAPVTGSVVRFNQDYGAMLMEAGLEQLRFRFITRAGSVIDEVWLTKPALKLYLPLIHRE
jgi:hypothetical protein